MSGASDSVVMIVYVRGDTIESISTSDMSEGALTPEVLKQKAADAVRASVATGKRRTEKLQIVRSLALIVVTLFFLSLVPLVVTATLLIREVTAAAGSARQTASALGMRREAVVTGIDTLARHAEDLSAEREQQLLRNLNIIVRRAQPFADTVRPLFIGTPK